MHQHVSREFRVFCHITRLSIIAFEVFAVLGYYPAYIDIYLPSSFIHIRLLAPEDGTDMYSRNVSK
jgi:hypothetical protein